MKISDIKRKCLQDMAKCMSETAHDADLILDESFNQYYRGGVPKYYERTFTLHNAKKITGPTSGENTVTLEAGYDGSQLEYHTGTFTGEQVWSAVSSGDAGVVGDPSFDEVALERIIQAAADNFAKRFR